MDCNKIWEQIQEDAANHIGVYTMERLGYLEFLTAKGYLDFLLPVLPYTDFQVKIQNGEDLGAAAVKEQVDLELRRTALTQARMETGAAGQGKPDNLQAALWGRLSYVYPHKNLERLYTKTTVSELKAEAMAERDEEAHDLFASREKEKYVPAFVSQEKKISGTLRGSAFHRAMEILDLGELLGTWFAAFPAAYDIYRQGLLARENELEQKLETFLQMQKENLKLSAEYYEAIDPRKVSAFLQTERHIYSVSMEKLTETIRPGQKSTLLM